uniref:Heat shock protein family A member 12 variant X4 n=1 Tax=Urechis unicinctus TaxID=6432 RepID=A0AAU0MUL5_UREUN
MAAGPSTHPFVAVAALDVGAAFSGYAFSFRTKPEDVTLFKLWGASCGIPCSFKTTTCLLLNANGELDSFGYEAQNKYLTLEEDEMNDYTFYEGFKMQLYDRKDLSRTTCVSSRNNRTCSLMDLMTFSLTYLKDSLIKHANQQTSGDVTASLLRWVVTVPAIWDDSAKQFMREAAVKAGLDDNTNASQLLIALEPEAASIQCRGTSVNSIGVEAGDRSMDSTGQLDVGTKFLVVDAGGGTLDMTAQEVLPEAQMQVLCCANGGPFGGVRVNELIAELLNQIYGADVMKRYREECTADYGALMNNIEVKKRTINREKKATFNLPISQALAEIATDYHKKPFAECISADMMEKGVVARSGILKIPHSMVLKAVTTITDHIVQNVDDQLKQSEVAGVSYIVMVGGFSESPVLQGAIKEQFGARYTVIIPSDASTAVLSGAVAFGHNPNVIYARRAQKTCAVEMWPPFVEGRHPESRKVVADDGACLVRGAVHVLVKKGEVVHRDEVRSYCVTPVYAAQPSIPIKVYRTDATDVMYADDPGMEQVKCCAVKLPGTGMHREAEVKFKFGETEVKIEAWDVLKGHMVHATYSCL